VVALFSYRARASGASRWAWFGIVIVILGLFGAWPVSWWGEPPSRPSYHFGLIWAPPEPSSVRSRLGDQPWFPVYHWHGLDLLIGNLYVLTGVALLGLLVAAAIRRAAAATEAARAARRAGPG